MHHDYTLEILDQVTTSLGEKLRAFGEQTRSAFVTKELHREFAARLRRQTEDFTASEGASPSNSQSNGNARLPKTLNLNTYKFHSLGDYVATIRKYGTTDSYSTEPVCDAFTVFSFCLPICTIYRENLSIDHLSPDTNARVASNSSNN